MPFQRCASLCIMVAHERTRQWISPFCILIFVAWMISRQSVEPSRSDIDINTVILNEALRHVDFTVDNQPPIRVLCDPVAHKRIDVPKVEPQVPGPFRWDVERRNHISRSIPALLIVYALSRGPP